MSNRCPDCDRPSCPWFHRNDADRSADELGAAITDCHANAIDHHASLVGLVTRILGSGKLIEERGIGAAVTVAAERVDDLRREIGEGVERENKTLTDSDAFRAGFTEGLLATEGKSHPLLGFGWGGLDALLARREEGLRATIAELSTRAAEAEAGRVGLQRQWDGNFRRVTDALGAGAIDGKFRRVTDDEKLEEMAAKLAAMTNRAHDAERDRDDFHRAFDASQRKLADAERRAADAEWLHAVIGAPVSRDGGGR